MKVLYLHNSLYMGGAELSLVDLVVGLRSMGVEPYVVNVGENTYLFRKLSEENIPYFVFPRHFFGNRSLTDALSLSLFLRKIICSGGYSLIHANSVTMTKYGSPVARLMGVPIIGHIRDVIRKDFTTVRALGLSNLLLAISRFIASDLKEAGLANVRVVYNGIPFPDEFPFPEKSRGREILKIITPSSITRKKRLEDVVECAWILYEKGVEFEWNIFGNVVDEGYHRFLSEMISSSELEGRIKLEGYVRDVSKKYFDSDLVVVPSVDEPFGRIVVEAYRFCKPVICYKSGAFPELVKNGVTGFLVRPGDTAMMAEKVLELIDDEKRFSMGIKGFEFGRERFSLENLLKCLLRIYEELA